MEEYINKYLSHVGMRGDYTAKLYPCEICGDTKATIIREIIDIGKEAFGRLPVVACNSCGFLFQNPRFNKTFYDYYYSKRYRDVVYGDSTPSQEFVDDQIRRGELLYQIVSKYFDQPGDMLDVGSSVGAMMIPFIKHGWNTFGTDPDIGFVEYGRDKLNLPVVAAGAENMELEDNKYDFIMIIGSLEHCFDPNIVLQQCRKAARHNSILLLQGRGHPQKASKKYFNHNHHRYFTMNSIELIMIKHGWKPFRTTDDPICGESRSGRIYCFGRLSEPPSREDFLNIISSGKREVPQDILIKYEEIDRTMGV
tara:strand:+ start:570 stop:1496 length:927 start_codon:yes stop_codon:yes gene_type:complete